MSLPVRSFRIAVAHPFELGLVVRSHGWFDLAPHSWCEDRGCFETVLRLPCGPVDVTLVQRGDVLRGTLRGHRTIPLAGLRQGRRTLAHMLRLDEDLRPFWDLCRGHPSLGWVARRGAGRILRSPTVFEDLMRLLLTTNCSWAATRGMVGRLIEALGEAAPSGRRAFPGPQGCAEAGEGFFRETVRAGYRAGACVALARAFSGGEMREAELLDPDLETDVLRRRLLALPGFGPYAAGQALRLLGRHEDLALDSWCRGEVATLRGRPRPPADRTIERAVRRFGSHRGLALWLELTARWHDEAPDGARPSLFGPSARERRASR